MDNSEKFKKKKDCQPKEKFYCSLTGKKISDKEYEHFVKVCDRFEIKRMKDYHDLYLKCNVLLLANVFENFLNDSLKSNESCLSHYLIAPALSWNAMLNMTTVEFELISDGDMYLFFEKSMRGGFSYISKIYSKAINKYLES